ncbi:MAG: family NAD(P)-dependent oxidoreductase [Hydrocarboniphaga sp.]|uniref:SDR family NAD(P)-dependent oxidoreductase n=1 Tax=Hydrocarboniphaga sp. TaxID=2033016 RepID=UPI00261AC271|nr:SDR family NAD(P)-dependent oxidoreductase [Hydrocarboniphaga sp.]MDB5972185.1 family NAD(P)-dependent oxidoreductase [Hydrocarboniphaga sp.]
MNFADRYGPWAVVAGASEGTGRAFARQIAALGLPCILIARREAPLAALAAEIKAESGVDCVVASVDLAAPDAFERIVAAVGSREVGLFVSNAGADPHGDHFLDRGIQDWIDLAQRNTMVTLRCCHHFAEPMRTRGKGGILLVNSGACYGGASFMATYAASKAFTLCFAEGLWAELHTQGVDVLTLVLGRTDTPAFRKMLADKGQPVPDQVASAAEVAAMGLERLPHGPVHNWGVADDVAGFAPNSAAARRERILMVDRISSQIFGSRP